MKINLLYRLPLFGLCAVIAIQSHFPGIDIPSPVDFGDKIMHFGAYGLMGFLCGRWIRAEWPLVNSVFLFMAVIIFVSLFGALDEFHQSFIPARTASMYDFWADFAGSVAGSAAFGFCWKKRIEWLL